MDFTGAVFVFWCALKLQKKHGGGGVGSRKTDQRHARKRPCKLDLGGPHIGTCHVDWATDSGPKNQTKIWPLKGLNSNLHWAYIWAKKLGLTTVLNLGLGP